MRSTIIIYHFNKVLFWRDIVVIIYEVLFYPLHRDVKSMRIDGVINEAYDRNFVILFANC